MFKITTHPQNEETYFAINCEKGIPQTVHDAYVGIVKSGGYASISQLLKSKWIVLKSELPPVDTEVPLYLKWSGAAERQAARPQPKQEFRTDKGHHTPSRHSRGGAGYMSEG